MYFTGFNEEQINEVLNNEKRPFWIRFLNSYKTMLQYCNKKEEENRKMLDRIKKLNAENNFLRSVVNKYQKEND